VLPGAAVASSADGLKSRIPVEHRGVRRLSALRDRPSRVSEGVKTDVKGSRPAESDDAGGLGEVSKEYPQAPGTRPTARSSTANTQPSS
jgi:hypothetical protein